MSSDEVTEDELLITPESPICLPQVQDEDSNKPRKIQDNISGKDKNLLQKNVWISQSNS